MCAKSSNLYSITSNTIAVLDIGVSTQKIVVIDQEKPDEPLSYQRIFYPLKDKKLEFDIFLKSLLRSYSDFGIRKFILTTSAASVFSSAKEAVEFITDVVTKYIHHKNVLCFTSTGEFITIGKARKDPSKVVSSGWRGLGEGIGEISGKDALVVEFTTRTTSFIPIKDKKVLGSANNDYERIKSSELIFLGLLETNAAFIESELFGDGQCYCLPFEQHANTADIFLITNDLQSSDYIQDIGASKEQVREKALENLSKMLCLDEISSNKDLLEETAQKIKSTLLNAISERTKSKLEEYNLDHIILVGLGADILYEHLQKEIDVNKITQGKNLIHTTEINPAYAIGYIYATRMKTNE